MRLLWRRRSTPGPDHELIWLAVSIVVLAGGAAWLALSLPWPQCPFFAVTGLPCVTCGATRSTIAFLHGDFLSALRWNPLAFAAFCGVIAFDLYAAIVLVGRRPRLRIVEWTIAEKNVVRIAAISLLALNRYIFSRTTIAFRDFKNGGAIWSAAANARINVAFPQARKSLATEETGTRFFAAVVELM